MARLQRISDHVLVGTSASFTTTTTVVTGDDRTCVVIDPAVELADLAALVDDLVARELTVVAGFATHPHWDHVLWDAALGPAPRYATAAAVRATAERREHIVAQVEEFAPGIDPHLVGRLTALPSGATAVPWDGPRIEVVEHRAHAAGHAALLVVGDGVFVAGDMCSDIEVPLLDLAADDPLAVTTTRGSPHGRPLTGCTATIGTRPPHWVSRARCRAPANPRTSGCAAGS